MKIGVWKIITAVIEGILISIAARAAAWITLISLPVIWKLVGHAISDIAFHVLNVTIAH